MIVADPDGIRNAGPHGVDDLYRALTRATSASASCDATGRDQVRASRVTRGGGEGIAAVP